MSEYSFGFLELDYLYTGLFSEFYSDLSFSYDLTLFGPYFKAVV